MVYTLRFFFSSKYSLFHNCNLFGSCIIHILYTECAKIKKNNSGAKRLRLLRSDNCYVKVCRLTERRFSRGRLARENVPRNRVHRCS